MRVAATDSGKMEGGGSREEEPDPPPPSKLQKRRGQVGQREKGPLPCAESIQVQVMKDRGSVKG